VFPYGNEDWMAIYISIAAELFSYKNQWAIKTFPPLFKDAIDDGVT
jgi:hypothetical protein